MHDLFLVYNNHYSIETGGRFSSTFDLNKGKQIHDRLMADMLADETMFVEPEMIKIASAVLQSF